MHEFENEKAIQQDIRAILENMRELQGAIFIQSQRNYDMLAIIADKLGADAKGLSFLHEQGQVLAPDPAFLFENIDENDKNVTQDTLFDENMTNNVI
jgi:hypothetical protein